MKKKVKVLFVSLLSLLPITSCLLLGNIGAVKNDLSYEFTKEDEDNLRLQMETFEEAIKNDNTIKVIKSWKKINEMAYDISTISTIEHINYAAGNYSSYELYIYYSGLLQDIIEWQENQYQAMYASSLKDSFFAGMTEEEIQELLNRAKPADYYDLEDANEVLLKQYYDLDKASDTYNSDVDTIYKALVKNYQDEAKLLNYDNYLEYAYKNNYQREYGVSDITTFNEYVKTYIIPYFLSLKNEVKNMELSDSDSKDYAKLNARTNKSYLNFKKELSSYALFLGSDYEKNYNHIMKDGYITNASGKCNIDGAFTTYLYSKNIDEPIIYFGTNYQDVMTFVHEFGHYNAFAVNGPGAMSYDLAETQSQGNEMLFIAYLKDSGLYSKELLDYIGKTRVLDGLQTIVLASIVNEFEIKVFNKTDLTDINLDEVYHEAVSTFGDYDEIMNALYGDREHIDYWRLVALEHVGYYISYAMSYIPTFEIYSLALDDIKTAKEAYSHIYNVGDHEMTDFYDVLKDASLYNPFEEDAYKLIAKLGEK